jgi:glucose-6-phosphate isomerase
MISLDYTFMTAPAVDGGFTTDDLKSAESNFGVARDATLARHARGELGFLDLPGDQGVIDRIEALTLALREQEFSDVVILGIGGSALGPVALRTALRPSGWNSLSEQARGGLPRLHVLDNVDPSTVAALLHRLDLRLSLFVVISKSGSTAETMAQYLVVRDKLAAAGLTPAAHLVFVTDPERGALRAIAQANGIRALHIPPNVGGRFSVLSAVGLFPASLIGIDIAALLAGASAMRDRCVSRELTWTPAGAYATLQWLADTRRGRHTHVFMPYSDSLRDLADWFVQLWAESLGKIAADGSGVGPTPIGALGASDQHSQMQLFIEGPADKTVTLVAVREGGVDLSIPTAPQEASELAYLAGHRLGELLAVERQATAGSLAKRGRLNMTITLDRVDPWHIGGILMLLEIATAFAGELYAVDAFNQPGVELAKNFTYALLGRDGFEDVRREWESLPRSNSRFIV